MTWLYPTERRAAWRTVFLAIPVVVTAHLIICGLLGLGESLLAAIPAYVVVIVGLPAVILMVPVYFAGWGLSYHWESDLPALAAILVMTAIVFAYAHFLATWSLRDGPGAPQAAHQTNRAVRRHHRRRRPRHG